MTHFSVYATRLMVVPIPEITLEDDFPHQDQSFKDRRGSQLQVKGFGERGRAGSLALDEICEPFPLN